MNFKRKVIGLLVIGMFISVGPSRVSAENIGNIVNDDAVINILNDVNSEVIGNISLGEQVEVLNVDGDFYKVAIEGIDNAFILEDYIKLIEADGIVVGDSVIVRKEPNQESEEINKLSYGSKVSVNGINGDYYRINYEGSDAYIHSNFVIGDMLFSVPKIESMINGVPGVEFGTVVSKTGANLRTEGNSESSVIMLLPKNTIVDVLDNSNKEWVKIKLDDKEGYVSSEFLVIESGVKPEQPEEVIEALKEKESNTKSDEIIGYAEKFLGTPYVWGGTNLRSGVDCSGFVYSVMKDNGIYLNRTSSEQAYNGVWISKENLKKGDLVFFDTSGPNNGNISHVGIYIGEGNFIHSASGSKMCVTESNLSDSYYTRNYVTARRVIQN